MSHVSVSAITEEEDRSAALVNVSLRFFDKMLRTLKQLISIEEKDFSHAEVSPAEP